MNETQKRAATSKARTPATPHQRPLLPRRHGLERAEPMFRPTAGAEIRDGIRQSRRHRVR